jgi:serine/threonine protein kinase
VDFGSVRNVLAPDEGGSTVAGTYGYMPYEQYMGQATPSSDLYGLAATFLHLLTGRPPRDFISNEGRIDVPHALPGDPRLAPVIARMLKPSPPERFQSAAEVRSALLKSPDVSPSGSTSLTATTPAFSSADRTRMFSYFGVQQAGSLRVGGDPALSLPAPRPFKGPVKDLLNRLAPSMWQYMEGSQKRSEGWGVFEVVTVIFFSTLTAGTLPMLFYGIARSRRRKLKSFVREGVPGTARIVNIRLEELGFSSKIAQVSYEFEADGVLHRDVDQVLPMTADRWRAGDVVEILYLPNRDYDSVIVSTG